jgi:hypothetical protein
MGPSSDMKNRNEELLTSFKKQLKENEELVNDVHKTPEDFSKDNQRMAFILHTNAKDLREGLVGGKKDKLLHFNELFTGIPRTIGSIQKEVVEIQSYTFNMINDFNKDRKQMTQELNISFAKKNAVRMQNEEDKMEEFNVLMKDVTDEINNIDQDVYTIVKNTNNMFRNFEKHHREMPAELKKELCNNLTEKFEYITKLLSGFQKRLSRINKGNQKMARQLKKDIDIAKKDKLNEYKDLMVEIQITIKGIHQVVLEIEDASIMLIGDLAHSRELGASKGETIQNAINEFKKTTHDENSKELSLKTQKSVTSAELHKEIPDDNLAKMTDKSEFQMNMEEKVLAYIIEQPMGVKVSEMEKPLGVSRMKIGYTAKVLLEKGKLQKLDNVYFPKK